jgi:VIT1/CCC1 family predicted Fe2+/Mn2+ transporter
MSRESTTYPDLDPPPAPVPDPPLTPGTAQATPLPAPDEDRKKEKKKDKEFGRGVETMFRTSYRMHVDLAALADSKANILISINGLIISVILAALAPRIRTDLWLFAPTAVVLCTCLAAISFAVLAARPRITRPPQRGAGSPGEPPIGENLMFFGGFLSMGPDAYERAVQETIRQPERLYSGMARDIYGLGQVLDRKFRLLRLAYTVFMIGLSAGVLLYLVVFLVVAVGEPAPAVSLSAAGVTPPIA